MVEITKAQIQHTRIELETGDITQQRVDAIVNAANSSLLGGGGVDGAIHRAAGPELLAECSKLGGCPTGEARITNGYKLFARYVIHTVGPIYGLTPNPAQLLRNAHYHSLELAQANGVKTIAFPAISTGVYAYPLNEAAPIALNTVISYINENQPEFELVRFVLYTPNAQSMFAQALLAIVQARKDIIALR